MRRAGISALIISVYAQVAHATIRGVNAGGWFVLEPWMTPTIFNSTGTIDEWHLCNALGKQQCLETLEQHWSTFYTKDDFAAIKNAGLDAVRIPLGYWAVNLLPYEPYVSGQYPYLVRAAEWAMDLGLKLFLDIHGAPGSQNGWEETGLVGPIAFPANTSNSDRTLNVLQNLTQEFSQAKYNGVVTNIELLNEPIFALDELKAFYTLGANVVDVANVNGINTTIHDAFYNPPNWKNYDPNNASADAPAKYLTLDTHQFWGFPPLNLLTEDQILDRVCQFGVTLRQNNSGIPPTLVGEWSLDTGVTANSTTNSAEDVPKRTWFRKLFEAQAAAYSPHGPGGSSIGWYFWAWKTEYNIDAWSYSKGIAQGYIPSNVSNASTYVFPIMANGCIDSNFSYTAAVISSSSTTTSSATLMPTSSTSSPSSTAKASSKSTSGAASGAVISSLVGALFFGSFLLMSVA